MRINALKKLRLTASTTLHQQLRVSFGMSLLPAILMTLSVALAEQKQQQPTSDKKQLCKDLYNYYDTNMEIHYDKKNSANKRQAAYNGAQIALADFRKQGCKLRDVKQ